MRRFCFAAVISLTASSLAGCATPSGKLEYALPELSLSLEVHRELRRCSVKWSPADKRYEIIFEVEQDATILPSYQADKSYELDLGSLGGGLRDVAFTVKQYPNGTLQTIGSSVEDKTLPVLKAALTAALGVAGAPGVAVAAGAAASLADKDPAFLSTTPKESAPKKPPLPPIRCSDAATAIEDAFARVGKARQKVLAEADAGAGKADQEAALLALATLREAYAAAVGAAASDETYELDLNVSEKNYPMSAEALLDWLVAANDVPKANPKNRAALLTQAMKKSMSAEFAFEGTPKAVIVGTTWSAAKKLPAFVGAGAGPSGNIAAAGTIVIAKHKERTVTLYSGPFSDGVKVHSETLLVPLSEVSAVQLKPGTFGKANWAIEFEPSGRIASLEFGDRSAAEAVGQFDELLRTTEAERNRQVEEELARRANAEKLRACRLDPADCG